MTKESEKPYDQGRYVHNEIENHENRFEASVSREQAAQLMGGGDKLQRLLDSNIKKTGQELKKFPIGGTRLYVEFSESNEPIFKIYTSERHHQGKDIDKILRALDKYSTPVEGASWPGFTDPEI